MSLKCRVCCKKKPNTSFSKKSAAKTGYSSKCKECHNEYVRQVWYPRNKQKQIASSRKWRTNNRIKDRARVYKCSVEELQLLYTKAEGKCAICAKETLRLMVDHDHNTGKIRGALCNTCNAGLGFFKDNVNLLQSAISYIKHYTE